MPTKEEFKLKWFRKTLNEPHTYLITDKYEVYFANREMRSIGGHLYYTLDRPLKYFLLKTGKPIYFNSIEFLGILPVELRGEFSVNCIPLTPWEYQYYQYYGISSEDLHNLFSID